MVAGAAMEAKRGLIETHIPIEMGEVNTDPFEIGSTELNKKRKRQEGEFGLPSPKHNYKNRSWSGENESPITDDEEVKDYTNKSQNDWVSGGLGRWESAIVSNSFIEESDNPMTVEAEATPKFVTETNHTDWPPISSSSSSINNYKSNHCSPANITIKSGEQSIHVRNDVNISNWEDGDLQLEQRFPYSEDHLNELEMDYADFICSEYENNCKDQHSDVTAEEKMLYSNEGITPNSYVLSSGRWNASPAAELDARKPTIDQEFEQYFSTLML